ncbi:MAG: YqgE/AlgH family protein [Bacteroidales bacterium]|jgi:putative transcriptional regulator|nr:YqgE/AlgH family protein [Bacteroidales bacterium]
MDFDIFNISHNIELPQKGKVLVSVPFISDSFFYKTVIYLVEHSDESTVGIVLNKPLPMSLHELVEQVPESNFPVHIGGPAEHTNLHMLHTFGNKISGSVLVADGVYWGGDFEEIKHHISNHKLSKRNIRFFLGYSGWGKNQLKQEIEEDTWLVSSISLQELFSISKDINLWDTILKNMGSKYKAWTHFPPSPLFN